MSRRPPTPPQPWERQPGETPKQYAGFCTYRDLPPDNRNLDDAYRQHYNRVATAGAPSWWNTWSSRNNWPDRAALRDDFLEREARIKAERAWIARRAEHLESEWEARTALLAHAHAMAAHPITEERVEPTGHGDELMRVVRPAGWRIRDIAALLETASKLGRLATGLHTDHTLAEGPESPAGILASLDLTGWEHDDLETFRDFLARALARSGGTGDTTE